MRWLVALMIPAFAFPARAQQDPSTLLGAGPLRQDEKTVQQKLDELAQEIEKLKKQVAELNADKDKLVKENGQLRRDVEDLRTISEESAKEVLTLRHQLRDIGAVLPTKPNGKSEGEDATKTSPLDVEVGPKEVLRAKIWSVSAEWGFVIINKGQADGVKPGYRFDIQRRMRVPSGDPNKPDDWRLERLGTGEFEKYVGSNNEQSKLKIVEGNAAAMKYEDEAVAHRKLDLPSEATKEPGPVGKKYAITGKVGDAFMINYGKQQGAQQSDRLYVYRDGRLRAHLRLDVVEKDYSIGRLIDRTQTGDFGMGDEIQLKELKISIVGRVKWNDEVRGIILEAGAKNGVKPGMKFEVRRQGRRVGIVEVKKVLNAECEAIPTGDLKREQVYVEDFVESSE